MQNPQTNQKEPHYVLSFKKGFNTGWLGYCGSIKRIFWGPFTEHSNPQILSMSEVLQIQQSVKKCEGKTQLTLYELNETHLPSL